MKTISSEVNLSAINFGALDWLSAIPQYEALITGDTEEQLAALGELDALSAIPSYLALLGGDAAGLDGLDLLNGIPAWTDFIETGDLDSFTTKTDADGNVTQAGYAALNGTKAWENFLTSGDISSDGLGGIDAFSAIPAYATLLDSESTDEQRAEALSSLDSVSAIPALQSGDLSKLDSVNAIPAWQTALDSSASTAERADALRGLDLVSAIPEYLGLPSVPAPPPAAPLAKQVEPEAVTTTEEEPQTNTPLKQLSQTITQSLPQANIEAPAAPEVKTPELPKLSAPTISKKETVTEEKEASKGGGSYSGSFKPEPIVLFGSGKGNGADNGIRGWGEGLKKLGIGGGDTESAGGESGGEGAE
ncbi:hypothetical protein [Mycolicibacterium mageritense]|uniref:hypothetical protein n=1 Tax=Mycolicibacterium mageritense TaxID=53462 RepID=UPI001E491720|nr:hypothetical protein [Mycolicibacterium mageritense]